MASDYRKLRDDILTSIHHGEDYVAALGEALARSNSTIFRQLMESTQNGLAQLEEELAEVEAIIRDEEAGEL